MKLKKRWTYILILLLGGVAIGGARLPMHYFADPNLQNPHTLDEQRPVFPDYDDTIAEQDGKEAIVNNPDSILVLINKQRRLPNFYLPKDLIVPNVRFSFSGDQEKMKMRKEAARALENLFKEAEKQNIHLFAVSAFRSYERQKALNSMYKLTEGEAAAAASSASPGTSEHQTGLAVDVSAQSVRFQLQERFAKTKEGIWLAANAHKYGFIIRYPQYKQQVTGYTYEPWHIRYIGKTHAAYLYEHHLALEEAIQEK